MCILGDSTGLTYANSALLSIAPGTFDSNEIILSKAGVTTWMRDTCCMWKISKRRVALYHQCIRIIATKHISLLFLS